MYEDIRLKVIPNQTPLKAQLPDYKQNPVQQLQPHAACDAGLDTPATAAHRRRRAIVLCSRSRTEDLDQRINRLGPLTPEDLP